MQVNIQEGIIAEVHRFMTLDRETVRTFHESVIRIMELFGFRRKLILNKNGYTLFK